MMFEKLSEWSATNGLPPIQKQDATNAVPMDGSTLPPFYYDASRTGFWMPTNRGGWVTVNESAIRRELRALGISAKVPDGAYVSPLELALSTIQRERDVAYAGPLAGYSSGVYEIHGNRVLATSSPTLIQPKPGEWPTLQAVLGQLLNDPDHNQADYLFGWLKVAIESLRTGKRQPGQCLTLAGPRGCGKSLLQKVITELLGGREARPYRYMRQGTEFNADLFGAEHLVIEDEEASTNLTARRYFGTKIKELTVNSAQNCHPKHRQAISLTPFWRLSISINDEPENIMVLPPLDESLKDKLIILRARPVTMPMPTETADQRDAFWQTIRSELSAFVNWLTLWEIPPDLRSPRFGVTHFHHPAILDALGALSPEMKLLDMIDAVLFPGPMAETWEGTAAELEHKLKGHNTWCHEARQLLCYSSACGVYLGRLAARADGRVEKNRKPESRRWIIKPPEGEE